MNTPLHQQVMMRIAAEVELSEQGIAWLQNWHARIAYVETHPLVDPNGPKILEFDEAGNNAWKALPADERARLEKIIEEVLSAPQD